MSMVVFSFVIALCTQTTRGQLLTSPMNTIATSGERVEFECSTNLTAPLRWDFAAVGHSLYEFIYLNEKIPRNSLSRYKVDTSRIGYWTLVIDSVDMTYAGTYRCLTTPNYPIGEIEMSVSAQLIIIDSDPVFDTNASIGGVVEGDYIQMQCTFNYSGNWIPVMKWTRNDGQTVDQNIQLTYDSGKVTSAIVTQLNSSDNGVTFTWKSSLRPNTRIYYAKSGEIMATNIAHYKHLWNFTTNVLYGPRTQTILLIDKALYVGSRLECYADGNPAPSYEWEIVGKNISLKKGSVIVISESMVSDEEQTLRCIAMNSVAGQVLNSETTFTFNLTDGADYSASNGMRDEQFNLRLIIIGSIVGSLIFCLVIALITYKTHRKRHVENQKSSHETSKQEHDYEKVDELNTNPRDFANPSLNKRTPTETSIEPHSPENIDSEDYASLKRSPTAAFVQPAVYAQLQLYANISVNEN